MMESNSINQLRKTERNCGEDIDMNMSGSSKQSKWKEKEIPNSLRNGLYN